ncbi:MAG: hypothetical protein R2749_19915 [Acidimicrobiales bacterium]
MSVLDELDRRASGRPRAAVILATRVLAMLEDDGAVSSRRWPTPSAARGLRLLVLRGRGPRRSPPRHRALAAAGVPPPLEGWARSRLDPLARMALRGCARQAVAVRAPPRWTGTVPGPVPSGVR